AGLPTIEMSTFHKHSRSYVSTGSINDNHQRQSRLDPIVHKLGVGRSIAHAHVRTRGRPQAPTVLYDLSFGIIDRYTVDICAIGKSTGPRCKSFDTGRTIPIIEHFGF